MASRALSTIRAAYEATNAGQPDWAAANLPPDFELVPARSGLTGQAFAGQEGLARWFAELEDVWETVHVEIDEFVEFGDRVVALGRLYNRGRGSGMDLEVVAAHLWTIENDVPVRVELLGDRDEALRRGRAESAADDAPAGASPGTGAEPARASPRRRPPG